MDEHFSLKISVPNEMTAERRKPKAIKMQRVTDTTQQIWPQLRLFDFVMLSMT